MFRVRRGVMLAVVAAAAGSGLGAGLLMHPAAADTACAYVALQRESSTPTTVVDQCQETGEPRAFHVHDEHQETGVVPAGYPDGYIVDFWVTAPPPP